MGLELDLERVRDNAREAETEDLLERVTVYRSGMEPAAVAVLEQELWRRGVSPAEIQAYTERREREVLWERPGVALRCVRCDHPATRLQTEWFRLLGLVPLYPRRVPVCPAHAGAVTSLG